MTSTYLGFGAARARMGVLALVMAVAGAACDEKDPGSVATARTGGSSGSGSGGSGGSSAGTGGSSAGTEVGPADAGNAAVSADIVGTATAAGNFTTLLAAATAAELVATLQSPGPFTVFAPTDAAFMKLPAGTVDSLLKPENKAQLQAILKYHLVAGRVLAADVVKLTKATTVEGRDVKITVDAGKVKVNDANVTATDILASNGVIHVIDTVLIPPTVVSTAEAAGNFKTLVADIKAAELADALSAAGPFTVFAPTDAAFMKLPAGTVDTLLKPENKAMLQAILKYHVVAGRVPSSEVVKRNSADTLAGKPVTISVQGTTVKVNTATVTTVDVEGGNGVIHVIDTVLIPPT